MARRYKIPEGLRVAEDGTWFTGDEPVIHKATLRYLKARRKQAFTSLVSGVSILGIAVGVAALIIALALLTGFQEDIQSKIIGANAHIVIWGVGEVPLSDYRELAGSDWHETRNLKT